jgi:ribose 1,5-bisphosphokinase
MTAPGRLIAVVGASGVGKDALIEALARSVPGLCRLRRVITRPPGPGERFESLDEAGFARLAAAGGLCLSWRAHGLSYGIPAAGRDHVAQGGEAIANLSRGVLAEAAEVFPRLTVLHLTARPETLAARLGGRGREDAGTIRARLARADLALAAGDWPVVTLANDGPLAETLVAARLALYPERR